MDFTKPPNKIVVYCVAGVMVSLWLGVWIFGPKREKVQPGAPLDKMLVALTQGGKQEKKEVEKKAKELVPGDWGRDPFYSPYQTAEKTSTAPEKVAKARPRRVSSGPEYKVSTILVSGSSRLAVINDKVYAVGDKIGGEEISKITLDHIVLTDNSQERVLRVPQPKTQVTVEDTEVK
jgi:hypothetical protein